MTLIIAYKNSKRMSVLSDTHLTNHNNEKRPQLNGVLKTAILMPELCVSASGSLEYADKVIATCPRVINNSEDIDKIARHFLSAHKKDEHTIKTGFIVMIGHPHNTILQIKKGAIDAVDFAWIGSQRGFELFQKHRAKPAVNQQYPEELHFARAFTEVVNNTSVPEVGGFAIQVGYSPKYNAKPGLESIAGFNYPNQYSHDGFRSLNNDANRSKLQSINDASSGGYSLFLMAGRTSSGERRLSAYFPQGGFGILFQPVNGGLHRPTAKITDSEQRNFSVILKEDYDVELDQYVNKTGFNCKIEFEQNSEARRSKLPIAPRIEQITPFPSFRVVNGPPDGPITLGEIVCSDGKHRHGPPLAYARQQLASWVRNTDRIQELVKKADRQGYVIFTIPLKSHYLEFRLKRYPIEGLQCRVKIFDLI